MKPFTTVRSHGAPLPLKDVDTDMIIPAQFLTSTSRDGFGENLFARLRASDPRFFMNQDRYQGAEILIAGSNFGCGSSREHAVWALRSSGIKVVIAPSFADIFASNSSKNGLLLVRLDRDTTNALLRECAEGKVILTVDLERQVVVTHDGREWSFPCDPYLRHCLLNGLDDMDFLCSRLPDIRATKAKLQEYSFFSIGTPNR
jgi:3-isopropylmalate/(R)-2-methylmalate dehydratase small subunit